MKYLMLMVSLLVTQVAFGADLTSILKKYQGNTKLTVEYSTFSTVLNEAKLQKGEIYLRPGKFNWTFTNPADKQIVYNGKTITYVEKEANANLVTTRKGVTPKQLVWFQLFSAPQKLKLLSHDKKTGVYKVKLDKYTLEITVDQDLIKSFTYFDELDSRITLTVTDTKFKDDSKVDFSYTPKKTDQVTEF
jgi:outer membrane lipoprotein-sorting protein